MRIKVETLRHELDVFMWENPDWAESEVVMEFEQGGRIYARRVKKSGGYGKNPFNIQWEEKLIYEDIPIRRSNGGQ